MESWGADVLLIPRLEADAVESTPQRKRKRSKILPKAVLLDDVVLADIYGIEPRQERGNFFTFRGLNFEYGLVRKSFDFHSLKADVLTIPSYHLHLFQFCRHPALNKFPRPAEWIFEEGERVVIRSSGREGVVVVIASDYLEVDLEGDDMQHFSWDNVWKFVKIGDFIIVTSGLLQGESGFVTQITDEKVNFVEKLVERSDLDDSPEIHV